MKSVMYFIISPLVLFVSSCQVNNSDYYDSINLATEALMQIDFIDDDFIILKHRQGVFNQYLTTEDSVELIFNQAVIGVHAKSLVNKHFENNTFSKDLNSSQRVTGVWPKNRIGNYKVRKLHDLLLTKKEEAFFDNWVSFDGLKSKNLIIVSDPIYTRDKNQAIIGLQVYTDSLYYINVVTFRKEQQWEVNSTYISKQRLLEFNIGYVEGDLIITPTRTVLLQ